MNGARIALLSCSTVTSEKIEYSFKNFVVKSSGLLNILHEWPMNEEKNALLSCSTVTSEIRYWIP